MAHKHNRRRVRHRARRSQYEQSLPTVYEAVAYHSLSSLAEPQILDDCDQSSRSSTASPPTREHVVKYQKPWIDPVAICDSYSSALERLAIRKFGGEPGENEFGLIDKMQEMFDSMNWVI